MMQLDESRVYLEFIETVRGFHQANAIYLEEMHRLTQERQAALAQAVKIHLDPLLAKLRIAQVISAAVAAVSTLVGIGGLCANLPASSSGAKEAGVAATCSIFFLFLLALAILSGAVCIWSSHRISTVRAKIRQIQNATSVRDRGHRS